jgi:hypothetical protein
MSTSPLPRSNVLTHSKGQSNSVGKEYSHSRRENSTPFKKSKSSLWCSQKPGTGKYPQTCRFISHPRKLFLCILENVGLILGLTYLMSHRRTLSYNSRYENIMRISYFPHESFISINRIMICFSLYYEQLVQQTRLPVLVHYYQFMTCHSVHMPGHPASLSEPLCLNLYSGGNVYLPPSLI